MKVPSVDGDTPFSKTVLTIFQVLAEFLSQLAQIATFHVVVCLQEDRPKFTEPEWRVLVIKVIKPLKRVIGLSHDKYLCY